MLFLYKYLIAPFIEFAFMQRALTGALMLSDSACPVGVCLMLRRMSLTGDAMAMRSCPAQPPVFFSTACRSSP